MQDAQLLLASAFARGRRGEHIAFESLDISKAFDSVLPAQGLAVLSLFGAPRSVVALVAALYESSQRLFWLDRGYASVWRRADHGLFQGCPWSPLVFNGIMAVWV